MHGRVKLRTYVATPVLNQTVSRHLHLTLLNLIAKKTGGLYCFKIGSTCSLMMAEAACKQR